MTGSARVRAAAAMALAAVLDGESLQTALPGRLSEFGDRRDGARLQALVYGSVRWFFRLQALLDCLLDRPLKARDSRLRGLLLVGLYDLAYGHTPEHAAVAETVNACEKIKHARARGLVNAVLRRYLREREALEAKVDRKPHVRDAHPAWLHEALISDWPTDWRSIVAANNEHPPMWLRVNRRQADPVAYRERLTESLGMTVTAHPAAPEALCLADPVPVSALPGFDEGLVSVQDAGAQLAARLLGATAGQRVLDACAAPGGKAAHIAELADCRAQVIALDISGGRLERIRENVRRLRLDRVQVTEGDALHPADWWDGEAFDRILLDVPCSATGVIRRHPDIRILRRASDVPGLARSQLAMLVALWPLLRQGGRLLYATCSVLRDENQAVIAQFRQGEPGARAVDVADEMPGRRCGPGQQVLPGETGMDGFYYACLEKSS